MKTIKIEEKTHQKLILIKAKWQAKTISEVLEEILDQEYYKLIWGINNDKSKK